MGNTFAKDLGLTCRSLIKILFCAKTLSGGRWTYLDLPDTLTIQSGAIQGEGAKIKAHTDYGVHFGNCQRWLHHNSKPTACIHFHPVFTGVVPVA